MKKLILIPIIILTLVGCNKEKFDSIPHGYYTMEYTNWAWGYSHSGWIINPQGDVMSFDLPENWNGLDSLGYISEAKLMSNISNCNAKIDHVSKQKLYKYNKLINDAEKGSYTEKVNTANDAGKLEYYCYLFDSSLERYKKVSLWVEGDFSYYNKSRQAKNIADWMKKIE